MTKDKLKNIGSKGFPRNSEFLEILHQPAQH